MLELVLEFLQSVVGKSQEQFDPPIGRFRIADFVRLHCRKIVLLLRNAGSGVFCRTNQDHRQQTDDRASPTNLPHDAPAYAFFGGEWAGGFSPGRLGKSKCSKSSSILLMSPCTSSSGGLYSGGATIRKSSSSRRPSRTCISRLRNGPACLSALGCWLLSASSAVRTLSRYFSIWKPTVWKSSS